MRYLKKIPFILLFGLICLVSCQQLEEVSSPNGDLRLVFSLDKGIPLYSLQKDETILIKPSRLGFKFITEPNMDKGFKLIGTKKKQSHETWEQPWGEFREVVDNHHELKIKLQEKSGEQRMMNIVFRVFNDGMGFRYEFPEQDHLDSVKIADELTEFTFEKEHDVWWIPVHSENSFYESFYRKTKMGQTDTINTPATFETDNGLYMAIHEANLTDFASMTLRRTQNNQYVSELVPWSTGVKVYAQTPFNTPWRTLIVGDKPGDLATSTLTLNLNEPNVLEDVSWIEPSKYIGIWWGMHLEKYTWGQGPKHGATTENVKRHIDFAAKNGFDGVLVEGWNYGWDGDWANDGNNFNFTKPYPDFDLEEISKYAALNNVRIIGHHETGGAATNYENQMHDAFDLYQKNGINAVKTGYVNKFLDGKEWHDSQYGVRHYRKVIETAAKYRIMIDNHEPIKGTGLQRTYPNLMTQEGGRGQEYDAWSADGGNTPAHTTIIPFTRMLAGPFDFTPGTFNFDYQVVGNTRVQTTLAKQLALYVVIFSPQQMASDLPENYEGNPAFEFIKKVPAIWSQTKVLDAEIGKYIVTARQDWDSDDWYLGAITNEEERSVKINLSFLDKDRTYQAEIYADGDGADYSSNPYPIEINTQKLNNTDVLELNMAAGGGTAIHLSPLP